MEAYFTKRDLKKFLNANTPIGEGENGSVYKYNYDHLLKTYIDRSKRENPKMVLKEINDLRLMDRYERLTSGDAYIDLSSDIINKKNRLSYTKYSYDLIQGLAYYYEYCFGSILTFYKDYKVLDDSILNDLSLEELKLLFHNIEVSLNDLFDNCIYPIDLKVENIMANKDLNVKLIDLDDSCTYYNNQQDDYYKSECLGLYKDLKKGYIK